MEQSNKISSLTVDELKEIIRDVVSEEFAKRMVSTPTYIPVQPVYPYPWWDSQRVYCTDHTTPRKDIQ